MCIADSALDCLLQAHPPLNVISSDMESLASGTSIGLVVRRAHLEASLSHLAVIRFWEITCASQPQFLHLEHGHNDTYSM